MNWIAVKGTENNFSIHAQRLQSLSDMSISSLSNSLRNAYKLKSNSAMSHNKYGITEIVLYFSSFLYFSNSTQCVFPYWISDLLYNNISQEEDCPIDFIKEFFSHKVCSLSNLTLANSNSAKHIYDRLSHVKSYHLTSLDFSGNLNIISSYFESLINSNVSQSLKTLKLRGCTRFHYISSLSCLTNLVELDLSENNFLEWNSRGLPEAMSVILSSFTHLKILDLHFTNFFSSCSVQSSYVSPDPSAHVKLEELYLFTETILLKPDFVFDVEHTCHFYEYLFKLPSLTHLDLSGWPCLDKLPENTLTVFSKKLNFFGLYQTSITNNNSDISVHSREVTGLSDEKYLVPTAARYYCSSDYLIELFNHIFVKIERERFIYSEDIRLELIHLVLDALDHYISLLPIQDPPSTWERLLVISECIKSLYELGRSIKNTMSNTLVRRSIESSITLLHFAGVNELSTNKVCIVVLDAFWICSLFSTNDCFERSSETMHFVLAKFLLSTINKVCRDPERLHSSTERDLSSILDRALYILNRLVLSLVPDQKTYVGVDLNGIDILMRFIYMKLTAKRIDEDLAYGGLIVMNMTYLCHPNCLRLCKPENRKILFRILGNNISHSKLVCRAMGTIENVAEFCILEETAAVSCELLAPVVTVLQHYTEYNQDAISSAVAFVAYFSLGHEKWGWEESGEKALSLASEVIEQLDYRVARSVYYSTLDLLVECLEAKDKRIMLCALWIICNLVYKNPECYLNLLSEEAIKKIRGILSIHPKDSVYHKLSREVMKLFEITTKCAELK